ncbi:cutinase [Diaporthe amygdali]|uniref:cutinase n=1 Tax=Phomopsis amygdali TaxID=1214568 RepID=UPI0022FE94F9|nr:cutinase [Diaporthe amygdali]KAJ0123830.1 cutinase [Diaporthe amygdali]
MKLTAGLLPALALSAHAFTIPFIAQSHFDVNDILALVSKLFPFDVTLEAAQKLNVAAEEALALALGFKTTRQDLNDGTCGDLLVVFSRGTQEPGNVGALVGPPFFKALEGALGSSHTLGVQGVDYDATVTDYLEGGDPEGSQEMASLVTKALSSCPNSKIVLSGYSQGGQLVHNAAKLLPAETMQAVSSVVIFGDPDSSQSVENVDLEKVMVVCHQGDDICQFGDLILLDHLTYAQDADTAAAFVVSKAGF